MEQQPFTLQPMNSIMQNFGSTKLGNIEPEPVQPSIEDQLSQAQQAQMNYQSYGQQHPILAQLGNLVMQQHGMNPVYDANGMGYQDQVNLGQMKRQVEALAAIKTARQEAGTNATHLGMYNSVAGNAGLPQADPNAVLNKDDLTFTKELLFRHGAPTLMAARDKFNQDMMAYQQGQTALANYNERKRLGLTDLNKEVAPIVPAKPDWNPQVINPYLDAGTVAGVTGTSNEAAKTGEEAASDAATNATALEGNKTQLAKLEAEINARQDANQLARDQMAQQDQHFTATDARENRKITFEESKGREEKHRNSLKTGIQAIDETIKTIQNQQKAIFGADSTGRILVPSPSDKAHYQQYMSMQNKIADLANKKGELMDGLNQLDTGAPPNSPAPIAAPSSPAASGRSLNQKVPSIKRSAVLDKVLRGLK